MAPAFCSAKIRTISGYLTCQARWERKANRDAVKIVVLFRRGLFAGLHAGLEAGSRKYMAVKDDFQEFTIR